jgi:transposase
MLMILDPEHRMEPRRFRALQQAGVSIAEIARETGHDWKAVKKYLAEDAPASRRRRGRALSPGRTV